MHGDLFTELSLIIVVGAAVSLMIKLFKQPLIIAYILTGILVGPSVFHIVKDAESIKVFSEIGITLLLFIIGLGLNVRVVKEVGKVAGLVGLTQVAITVASAYVLAYGLGYSKTESFLIGIALSFSSTIIILKLIGDKKEQNRLYGKIAIGVLLIQDIIATLALIFVTSLSNGKGVSLASVGILALKGAAITVPLFLVALHLLPRIKNFIGSSQEFLFLFAIAWGFGTATLFSKFGFSLEIGALLAGVSLASTPYAQEIGSRLRPLRDFFVVVFFINLGTILTFGSFGQLWPKVVMLSLIVLIAKPLITMIILGLMRYTKLTSFKAATSLAQVSEFSLVLIILASNQNLIRNEIVSIITIVALVTITISSYWIAYSDKIYRLLEVQLSIFERKIVQADHDHGTKYQLILFGYKKGGKEFLSTFKSLKKPYIVIDYDPEVIDLLERREHNFLYGDATDPEFLEEIGVEHARLVVSTISDFQANMLLASYIEKSNPKTVFICNTDNAHHASELYNEGADYVLLPHYIGTERVGAFIRKSGLKKSEFRKFRQKHLAYLENHYDDSPSKHHTRIGHAVLEKIESIGSISELNILPKRK
ncbi:cation:proton antiporter [Candidatus Saccharibacteria bacterium]|nr:cation:proton antiporter [Candidatus Saccharibacteria bacterium]